DRSGSAGEFDDRVLRYGRDCGVNVRGPQRESRDNGAGDQAHERPDAVSGAGAIGVGEIGASAGGAVRRAVSIEGCAGAGAERLRLRSAGYAAVAGNIDGERAGGFDALDGADSSGVL